MKVQMKVKEPWLGVILSLLYAGLGQLYANYKVRGLIILIVQIIFHVVFFLASSLVVHPDIIFTKSLVVLGFIVIVGELVFKVFVLFDSYACVCRYNIAHGLNPSNKILRIILVLFVIILSFGWGLNQANIRSQIRENVFQAFNVSMGAMYPTLLKGDRVIVNKIIYTKDNPQRGDIVLYKWQNKVGKLYLSRIVGLPGENLKISGGQIFIDEESKPSEFFYYSEDRYHDEGEEINIPLSFYYLLNDNSLMGLDSRDFGAISRENILGKATKIYWPLKRTGKVK